MFHFPLIDWNGIVIPGCLNLRPVLGHCAYAEKTLSFYDQRQLEPDGEEWLTLQTSRMTDKRRIYDQLARFCCVDA